MSFGTQEYSEALKEAVDAAVENGILIVASAGNYEDTLPCNNAENQVLDNTVIHEIEEIALEDIEVEGSIYIGEDCNPVEVYKMITGCTTSHAQDTERTFYMPSKLTRQLVGIDYGDGYQYLDESGAQIGRCTSAGENWKNQQSCLLLHSKPLEEAANDNRYVLFWLVRVQRGPTHRAYELLRDNIMYNTDRSFVVWRDGEVYKWKELKSIEPPAHSMSDYEAVIAKLCYGCSEDESFEDESL